MEEDKESGLTTEERAVSDALVQAWNQFMQMRDSIDADDLDQFRDAIHAAQRVLMSRIVRRRWPEYWS